MRADARLLGATLRAGGTLRHSLEVLPQAYLVVASGRIAVDGEPVDALDGVAISGASAFDITAFEDSELVLVEAG